MEETQQNRISYTLERMLLRMLCVILVALLIVFVLPGVWNLFSPFLIALAIAALLNPLVRFFCKKLHIKRGLSVAICVTLFSAAMLAVLYWFCSFVAVEVSRNIDSAPDLLNQAIGLVQSAVNRLLQLAEGAPESLTEAIQNSLDSIYKTATDAGMRLASSVATGVVGFAASLPYVFIYANFLIAAMILIGNRYAKFLAHFKFKKGKDGHGIHTIRQSTTKGVGGYIRVQVLFSVAVLILSWIFFSVTRFQYVLLLSLLAALLELIPQFGCGVLYIPWSIVAFLTGDPRTGWMVLGFYLFYSLLRRITEPIVLGSNLGVSPLHSLIGMFAGLRIGGIIGLILGPVIMVILVNAARAGLFSSFVFDVKEICRWISSRWKRGLANSADKQS